MQSVACELAKFLPSPVASLIFNMVFPNRSNVCSEHWCLTLLVVHVGLFSLKSGGWGGGRSGVGVCACITMHSIYIIRVVANCKYS